MENKHFVITCPECGEKFTPYWDCVNLLSDFSGTSVEDIELVCPNCGFLEQINK